MLKVTILVCLVVFIRLPLVLKVHIPLLDKVSRGYTAYCHGNQEICLFCEKPLLKDNTNIQKISSESAWKNLKIKANVRSSVNIPTSDQIY